MALRRIRLQPKQGIIYGWLRDPDWSGWIGAGGGRGAAKSKGADNSIVSIIMEEPGVVACVVMRNYDQVRRYHVEPILRAFPDLAPFYAKTDAKLKIPVGETVSEIDFSYAENLADVERRFRSANYKYIIVDQAEQFSEAELREMKNANRWPGGGAKMLLLFNMGGIGIQTLKKWFHTREYNEHENPDSFKFLHVYPWDNVEWSRHALEQDGLTETDYYSWTDAERFEYFTQKSEYGRSLNALPDALRNRDLLGGWNSLEGAYFGHSFSREDTLIFPQQVAAIQKPWDKRWMSQDWGKSHFNSTLWHSMSTLTPSEAKATLNWDTLRPLKVICTYRSLIVNEMTSTQVGQEMVRVTPTGERGLIKQFFLSPDAFGERDSANTIADNEGKELRKYDMPFPQPADTDRPGGWELMDTLLMNTKKHGQSGDTVWLISSECPELLDSIPILMRDPKNLDVVLKTDTGQARLEQDVSESARYGLKSFLRTVAKPFTAALAEELAAIPDVTAKNLVYRKRMDEQKRKVRWSPQYP